MPCPAPSVGAGFTGCDVLDQAGVDRIGGLAALLPRLTGDSAALAASSQAGGCPLSGPFWGAGNILLGGAGSDVIEGRGGDDIIDGDKALTVRISVRDPANPATEIGSADLMEHQYQRDASGALTGATLQAAVFDGTVDPENLRIVRLDREHARIQRSRHGRVLRSAVELHHLAEAQQHGDDGHPDGRQRPRRGHR